MQFFDRSVVAGTTKRESDGALIADVRIARTGIQTYLGSELGRPDMATARIYRPGTEVFSADTMKSAAHRPVTNEHPPGHTVTAENWKEHAVGNTADEVSAEGIYLRVPLMVSDASAISAIEGGKREVSAGYSSELDWTAGITPAGEKYDAVQRNIRINHVAIVQRGRAGANVRIGDAWGVSSVEEDEEYTMDKPLKTVTVDGLSIETTDQGAQVIAKLQTQVIDMQSASSKVLTDHATVLAGRDKTIAERDAEISKLKTQVVDAATLDKLVAERAAIVAKARLVHKDVKVDGLSPAEIRRGAVALKLGDVAVKDKSDAYVDARFDILVEDSGNTTDTFRSKMRDGTVKVDDADPRDQAYTDMVKDLVNPETAKAAN